MLTLAQPRPVSSFVTLCALRIRKGKARGDANVAEVEGIASTEHKDHEGQILKQDGLDWRYFLREGWINYEHEDVKHRTRGAAAVIGYPLEVWPTTHDGQPATGLRAHVFLDDPRGAQVVKTLENIQKAIPTRQLGFSIEGDALDVDDPRSPKVIKKAVIYNVTLTANPVNPKARISRARRAEIRKSLGLGLGDLGIVDLAQDEAPSPRDPLLAIFQAHWQQLMRDGARRQREAQRQESPRAVDPFEPFDPLATPYDFTHKGGIGYQTPSQPSDGALSALVPQSLEGAPRKRRRPQSLAALLANLYNP